MSDLRRWDAAGICRPRVSVELNRVCAPELPWAAAGTTMGPAFGLAGRRGENTVSWLYKNCVTCVFGVFALRFLP